MTHDFANHFNSFHTGLLLGRLGHPQPGSVGGMGTGVRGDVHSLPVAAVADHHEVLKQHQFTTSEFSVVTILEEAGSTAFLLEALGETLCSCLCPLLEVAHIT